ncbi:hypothetical protein [Sphingomonas bacterium]|uniref:hypothetical protein n=1 Tax=Sphingomonas bacterium TaxID=1895847 RepID=UPI00157706D0|nr:hypothetical protein [Sphingomonas bacterium]
MRGDLVQSAGEPAWRLLADEQHRSTGPDSPPGLEAVAQRAAEEARRIERAEDREQAEAGADLLRRDRPPVGDVADEQRRAESAVIALAVQECVVLDMPAL